MKKLLLTLLLITLFLSPMMLSARFQLSGRILLQVEANGEAWYVNPDNQHRYFLGRPDDAFSIMRSLGLGISEKDYLSFNNIAPTRLAGKILLRAEAKGEAYYVNPLDLKMHYLGRPLDAFNVMRNLGLGISNNDLNKIVIAGNQLEYRDDINGFSFMYPASAVLSSSTLDDYLRLDIRVQNIYDLNHPAYNTEIAIAEREALSKGMINNQEPFSLMDNKLISLSNGIYAKQYIITSSFDVCSLYFQNSLRFYLNDKVVTITLYGPKNKILSHISAYVDYDLQNCGNSQKVWKRSGLYTQESFASYLKNNNLPEELKLWHEGILTIASSLTIN